MKKHLKNNIYSIINNELYVCIINIMKNVISVKLSAYFSFEEILLKLIMIYKK